MKPLHFIFIGAVFLLTAGLAQADRVEFTPRELFHIPFGKENNMLGAKIKDGNFLIPRDFTMDGDGHFYIYDSNNHRIVRFSSAGAYEMSIRYPATAQQIFAHADSHQNLWLLVSDPEQGLYYGVYDVHGKRLREGVFSQFNAFHLHVDDDYTLHVVVSGKKSSSQTYLLDQESLLMKKENVARPPEDHHQVRRTGKTYFIDPIPGSSKDDSHRQMQITNDKHQSVASIQGTVMYVTEDGDVYARAGACAINIYDVGGSLKGKVRLEGLPSTCDAVRFDSAGNIYELDGIPDEDHKYSPRMPGMRLILWERH